MAAHNVRPYVEWGFMPGALASGDQTVFWWQGNVTPPADWNEWSDLVVSLTRHWIERYGRDEVRQWPFEVWNEPNLSGFWKGADQAAYFKLYEVTVRAIKSVDAEIKVGGPAICGGQDHWIDDFLAFVRERDLPLDIFTRHLYAGETPVQRPPEYLYQPLSPPQKPIDELRDVRARIDRNGFANVPLHITEFNTSYDPLCPVHDTAYNAAYLARLLAEAGKYAESLSFWTFSDVFEEQDIPRALFHGGFGMLARHGIKKPTFHLFAFFSRLGETILHQDERSLVTQRADGSVALVAWNPRPANGGATGTDAVVGGIQAEGLPTAGIATADAAAAAATDSQTIAITIPWAGGNALALRQRVSDSHANPWELWRAMGRPLNPSPRQIDFLRTSAVPAVETAVLPATATRLDVRFSLDRNEITLVELTPFRDESGEYLGLRDSLIDGYADQPIRRERLS
jgi:xylan 1,4-beta-xylosidase